MKLINNLFTEIAREHLGIETLEARNRDSLDFHDVGVAGVRDALRAAYQAGVNDRPARQAEALAAGSPPAKAAVPIISVTVRGGLIEDIDATLPVHVVVEDWDVPDEDTGRKPSRNVWQLTAGLSATKAAKFRRVIAND